MKMFQCDRCGRMFYPESDNHTLYGNKNDVCFDLCCNCMRDFKSWLNMSRKEKNNNFDSLDNFYSQINRIKKLYPRLRIGEIIYLAHNMIPMSINPFDLDDKDYAHVIELYADKLEREKERGR